MSMTVFAPISVARCRNGVIEGHFQADRLTLPNGRCGVRWSGLVFPLHPENRIEVTDTASLPGECQPWLPPSLGWRVVAEPASAEAYVFCDGQASARDQMIASMNAVGLVVVRSGQNMSGTPGDWFIRVQDWTDAAADRLAEHTGRTVVPREEDGASLRERLVQERFEQIVAERDGLRQELADTRARLGAALAEVESGGAVRAQLQLMLDTMEVAESKRVPIEVPEPRPTGGLMAREITIVIQQLLPRVDLVRRSLAFICVELADRAGVWRGLAELDRAERGTPPAWKSVGGAEGWIERHFPNGQDNQGRLYARHCAARWQVLVSHKQDQAADMRWLRQPD